MIQVPFAIGESIVGLAAMAIRTWWILQIVVSAPLFLLLLLYFVLPESPRWLISTGRLKEAKETIENAAKMNKVKLSPSLLDIDDKANNEKTDEKSSEKVQIGIADLFKHPYVRRITLILFFDWIVVTLGKCQQSRIENV